MICCFHLCTNGIMRIPGISCIQTVEGRQFGSDTGHFTQVSNVPPWPPCWRQSVLRTACTPLMRGRAAGGFQPAANVPDWDTAEVQLFCRADSPLRPIVYERHQSPSPTCKFTQDPASPTQGTFQTCSAFFTSIFNTDGCLMSQAEGSLSFWPLGIMPQGPSCKCMCAPYQNASAFQKAEMLMAGIGLINRFGRSKPKSNILKI